MIAQPENVEIREQVPLGPLTTMGCGGSARYLARPIDALGAARVVHWARASELPLWILGGGSNVLVADQGLDGVVLQFHGRAIEAVDDGDAHVRVRVQAGVALDDLVAWSVDRSLAGVTCLSGIPGMVGAAPVQNVGAYGQAIGDVLEAVTVLDCDSGETTSWSAEQCGLGYRDSLFKRAAPGRFLILDATLRLHRGARPQIRYPELRERLGLPPKPSFDPNLPLGRVREAVLAIRRSKGMVVDADDLDSRSAGSFFVNPVVTQAEGEDVQDRLAARLHPGETMPAHRLDPRDGQPRVKLSAAWLIERCGMPKGYGDGRVGLSRKHVLAIVNRGGATTADVLEFADHVALRVHMTCGVQLRREPVLLGTQA